MIVPGATSGTRGVQPSSFAGELQGAVRKAGNVPRLEDAEHLIVGEPLGEVAAQMGEAVGVRAEVPLEDRAAVIHHADVEPRSAEVHSNGQRCDQVSFLWVGCTGP